MGGSVILPGCKANQWPINVGAGQRSRFINEKGCGFRNWPCWLEVYRKWLAHLYIETSFRSCHLKSGLILQSGILNFQLMTVGLMVWYITRAKQVCRRVCPRQARRARGTRSSEVVSHNLYSYTILEVKMHVTQIRMQNRKLSDSKIYWLVIFRFCLKKYIDN